MRAEERLVEVLDLLQRAIRVSGATQVQIDESIGRRRGYLSHVFQRRVELKLFDLLRILEVLSVEPAQLFTAVDDRIAELRRERQEGEAKAGGRDRPVLASNDESLERIVRQIIDRILDDAD